MEGFLNSFKPILQKYKIEMFLIATSLIIAVISLFIYIRSSETLKASDQEINLEKTEPLNTKIFVDISGAVEKPDLYEVSVGARLKDILILAGGLSVDADRNYFARNFNLARLINDQEKIYVPFSWEIYSGIFRENQRTLDYTSPQMINEASLPETPDMVNVNTATLEELDRLPGIGKVTAEKIITNRPYSSIDDLLNRKIVNKNVFEQIKSMIVN